MRVDILTTFPAMFDGFLNESIVKRAQEKGIVTIHVHNLRDFSRDRHRKVDDRPFGGGPGMVLRPEPIFEGVEAILGRKSPFDFAQGKQATSHKSQQGKTEGQRIVLLTPQGEKLNQEVVEKLSRCRQLILICGRYEGVDERVRQFLVTDEISIGDYVLMGGELPAMVLIESTVRFLPGALGDRESISQESFAPLDSKPRKTSGLLRGKHPTGFAESLLEYPHYTRPAVYRGKHVPSVLLSGDHKQISEWRKKEAFKRTAERRPDLLNETQTYGGRRPT